MRSYRKSCFQQSSSSAAKSKPAAVPEEKAPAPAPVAAGGNANAALFVKVSMDGAPYLRKVDLRTYGGYRELRDALFGCFSSAADGACQFAIAYEDKDGDLMLAGDVPWE